MLRVTPKTTQLEGALEFAPAAVLGDTVVVPLMNGVEHVAVLRGRYAHLLAGAMFVESERVEPGLVRQKSSSRHPEGSFYVRSPRTTLGLVPFPGSTVVWPWEAGWAQDLPRANRAEPEERTIVDLAWLKTRSA